jgi:serine/threonine-protein kinase
MEDLVGKKLGQYLIESKIGEGSMASVFKAYQLSLDRYVAIKVLPTYFAADNPEFVIRFQREAKSIARLHHPNILPVYDFGIDRDYSYIVMRYVEGGSTLGHLILQSLSRERGIDLLSQVANAVTYAHQHGVIHRDIKPSNILLDAEWALLSDFGLAKVEQTATKLTDSRRSIGTPAYMSPEQALGGNIDHHTDIYALGVILYEILTKTIPHEAPTPLGIMLKRTTQPPVPPRTLDATISKSVEQVILRSLATNPEFRYESATDFTAALKEAMEDEEYREPSVDRLDKRTVVFAPHPLITYYLQKNSFKEKLPNAVRNLSWVAIVGIIVAALAIALWGSIYSSGTASQAGPVQTIPMVAVFTTSTNTPTLTSTPVPTNTPVPSDTPVPATPTSTPTRVSSSLPLTSPTTAVTPTSAIPEGVWTLLKPVSLEEPSYGPTDFEWIWEGPVPPNSGFEVRVWREGELPVGAHDAVLDNQQGRIKQIGENKYRVRLDIRAAYGVRGRTSQYLWTVALVQISPNYADLGQQAVPARFRFEAGGESKSGGGGGESGGGGVGID